MQTADQSIERLASNPGFGGTRQFSRLLKHPVRIAPKACRHRVRALAVAGGCVSPTRCANGPGVGAALSFATGAAVDARPCKGRDEQRPKS